MDIPFGQEMSAMRIFEPRGTDGAVYGWQGDDLVMMFRLSQWLPSGDYQAGYGNAFQFVASVQFWHVGRL
jgi:hypothetical protein